MFYSVLSNPMWCVTGVACFLGDWAPDLTFFSGFTLSQSNFHQIFLCSLDFIIPNYQICSFLDNMTNFVYILYELHFKVKQHCLFHYLTLFQTQIFLMMQMQNIPKILIMTKITHQCQCWTSLHLESRTLTWKYYIT